MIIPGELAEAYNRIYTVLQSVKARCDVLLEGAARVAGGQLVPCRIKPLESILLKTEKRKLAQPFLEIEDLVAGMIVVPHIQLYPRVDREVTSRLNVIKHVAAKTIRPQEFLYDDTHYVFTLRPDPGRDQPGVTAVRCELQVKTQMRAAAGAISRDLEYKTRWLLWKNVRLASRVRALVELVDDSLSQLFEAEDPTAPPEAEAYEVFADRNRIISLVEERLGPEQIPQDRRRMAEVVEDYMKQCKPPVSIDELSALLQDPLYGSLRSATSLGAIQVVFLVLFLAGRISSGRANGHGLYGTRKYLISREMIDLCPELRAVPQDRRIDFSIE